MNPTLPSRRLLLATCLASLALFSANALAQSGGRSYPTPQVSPVVPETATSKAYRSAGGDETALLAKYGYQRDEYFISGTTAAGPYKTRILIARPQDPKKFSGVMLAEVFQTSVWLQVRDYMMRSGHGWIMISSRGNRWLSMLKSGSEGRYTDFALPADELNAQIMYQVANMLRSNAAPSPLAGMNVRTLILSGYSGDGAAVRQFIEEHHATSKLANGRYAFDGYFVAATAVGSAPRPIGDIDLPVIELMNENEMIRSFQRGSGKLAYRREDGANYRLYEIAGSGHITTRGIGAAANEYVEACAEGPQSQFPMNHLYSAALNRLVQWIGTGKAPPHADRIHYLADGKTIARDDHGNAIGGVRSTYLDVPFAKYDVGSTKKPGYTGEFARCDMIAHLEPFSKDELTRLYKTSAGYAQKVATRADELVREGWYLAPDAEEIKQEARQVTW